MTEKYMVLQSQHGVMKQSTTFTTKHGTNKFRFRITLQLLNY